MTPLGKTAASHIGIGRSDGYDTPTLFICSCIGFKPHCYASAELRQSSAVCRPSVFSPFEPDGPSVFEVNNDVSIYLLSFLSPRVRLKGFAFNSLASQELCRVAETCKYLRDLAYSNDYWLPLFRRDRNAVHSVPRSLYQLNDWKAMYEKAEKV